MITPILAATNDDAFVNEFQVVIPPFPGCIDPLGVNLRVTKLDLPAISHENYTVHWKTESAEKPSGKQTTEKKFTIGFRIDKNWNTFKSFLNWSRVIHDPATGTAAPDYVGGLSAIRVPITIFFLDGNGFPTSNPEVYLGCYINGVPARAYDYAEGTNITMDFEFIFSNVIPTT